MSELSLDADLSIELSGWGSHSDQVNEEPVSLTPGFHTMIHSPSPHPLFQSSHEFRGALANPKEIDSKILNVSLSKNIVPCYGGESGGSVQGDYIYTWDGKGDGKSSWGVSGEAHDSDGNQARAEYRQNSDGSGSASVGGGRAW